METNISAPTRLEEILAEWDLDDNASETITLTNTLRNVSIASPYTVTGAVGAFPNTIYTTGTGTAAPWATFNPNTTSAKINLTGDEADIKVNGWSLVDAVKRIEQRLDLFQPNPELEKEWADLKKLGERYRKLEQHIRDKQATWDRLKSMPAPDIE
jgi:hypothetical protein